MDEYILVEGTMSYVQQLLSLLENSMACPGYPDEQFIEMAGAKTDMLLSRDGKTVVRVDYIS